MPLPSPDRAYPWEPDRSLAFLSNVVHNPAIEIGAYTFYHDVDGAGDFERRNVLYHYPVNGDRLTIGKFCSIATGVRFLFNGANHAMGSLSTYPFPIFDSVDDTATLADAWDNHGDISVGNDVWIGYEAVILAGVRIGDGAIIGARAVVTRDVAPYAVVAGVPARTIRRRFDEATIGELQTLAWWNWPADVIAGAVRAIRAGDLHTLKETARQLG
jgi:virginiamycin A acetyltransferase